MAKTQENPDYTVIRKALEDNKAILGTQRTIKSLRAGSLDKVFVTKNAAAHVVDDIMHYAELSKVDVVELGISNKELGTVCKKPFVVSIMAVAK